MGGPQDPTPSSGAEIEEARVRCPNTSVWRKRRQDGQSAKVTGSIRLGPEHGLHRGPVRGGGVGHAGRRHIRRGCLPILASARGAARDDWPHCLGAGRARFARPPFFHRRPEAAGMTRRRTEDSGGARWRMVHPSPPGRAAGRLTTSAGESRPALSAGLPAMGRYSTESWGGSTSRPVAGVRPGSRPRGRGRCRLAGVRCPPRAPTDSARWQAPGQRASWSAPCRGPALPRRCG
jgi:hypothetical protein